MDKLLNKVLTQKFGYSSFRPGQKEAITSVLNQTDTLVMLPTGTGKSLCYQLPAYLLDGLTLIVSPLLSLMQDQVESLRLNGEKRVVALNSLTPYTERKRIFSQINAYRFLYTSPEMLQNEEVLTHLKKVKVSLFVVDEAHCISHWGTDFRPDYLSLANVRKQLNYPTTMALTATATAQVRSEIIHFLGLTFDDTKKIIQSVDRPEIKFIVEGCEGDKLEKMLSYVTNIQGAGIIYFMSKNMADQMAQLLRNEHHIKAESYHSDIEGDDKIKIQQQFLKNDIQVVCATSAFGMGFDKDDIRYVIHYHLPGSPEMYLQEIGRASRDGNLGMAILLYQPGDEQIQKRFLEDSLPTSEMIAKAKKDRNKTLFNEEPVYKLARYFVQTHTNDEEIMETIRFRKEIKQNQIEYMVQYVYGIACKRKTLLQYFDENEVDNESFCCSQCGIDKNILIDQINDLSQHKFEEKAVIPSWKQTFSAIYNMG